MDAPSAALGLWGIFASSFLSATLLPGNSEIVLGAMLHAMPSLKWPALAIATLGNTLGGLTSYLVGRLLPRPQNSRALDWLHRFGTPALLLSWLPFVGDALCVASGWLRQNAVAAAFFIALGKFARYWVIAQGVELLAA